MACEVNTYKTDEYFASTPPLEAKKLLFSEYSATARRPMNLSKEIVLSFVDIKKAYFNGVPRRNIHLAFPKELGVPDHLVAHLKRCVYGTRDAGGIWEECFADALVEMGFTRGVASPCCFHYEGRNLHVGVHGDDFACLGPKSDIIWYEGELATDLRSSVVDGLESLMVAFRKFESSIEFFDLRRMAFDMKPTLDTPRC